MCLVFNIIVDFFFVKCEYVNVNCDKLQKLYEGWMCGVVEINVFVVNKIKVGKILVEGLGIFEVDVIVVIDNVCLVMYGDNKNFFGLNMEFNGVDGNLLYLCMVNEYQKLGVLEGCVLLWCQISMLILI